MKAELKRTSYNEDGTFGMLYIDDEFLCYTMEPEDKGNKKNISCIPLGEYVCKRIRSHKFGNTFEVTDVPNRSAILIHSGNTEDDTRGCLILGDVVGLDENKNKIGVFGSKKAFKKFFEKTIEVNEFNLNIINN